MQGGGSRPFALISTGGAKLQVNRVPGRRNDRDQRSPSTSTIGANCRRHGPAAGDLHASHALYFDGAVLPYA